MEHMSKLTSEECTLVVNHQNLVSKVADWLQHKEKYTNRDDLLSAGYEGLIKAAKSYNGSKGTFSSFAWKCIVNAMRDDIRLFRSNTEFLLDWEVNDESEDGNWYLNWHENEEERPEEILERIVLEADLTEREWYVTISKYGIDGEPRSTNQIAAELGKTPQMVNVIKREALAKMRSAA